MAAKAKRKTTAAKVVRRPVRHEDTWRGYMGMLPGCERRGPRSWFEKTTADRRLDIVAYRIHKLAEVLDVLGDRASGIEARASKLTRQRVFQTVEADKADQLIAQQIESSSAKLRDHLKTVADDLLKAFWDEIYGKQVSHRRGMFDAWRFRGINPMLYAEEDKDAHSGKPISYRVFMEPQGEREGA